MHHHTTDNDRRKVLAALAAGGGLVGASHALAATGTANGDHLEQHFRNNHYHKFHVGPIEFDVVADIKAKVLRIKGYPFFSSHICFMELELSEEKGFDVTRAFHIPELGWGGEGEFEVDLGHHVLMCRIDMETPFGHFKVNPTWHWA